MFKKLSFFNSKLLTQLGQRFLYFGERLKAWEFFPSRSLKSHHQALALPYISEQPRHWKEHRLQAAALITAVLDEALTPTQALIHWPIEKEGNKSTPSDPSLQAAYQILWHFESDEAAQQQEAFYLDAQLELLKQSSVFLSKGEALPDYLLEFYSDEHYSQFYAGTSFFKMLYLLIARPVGIAINTMRRVI